MEVFKCQEVWTYLVGGINDARISPELLMQRPERLKVLSW